ncbi:MAG: ureidoglycolate lyase [bacterium]
MPPRARPRGATSLLALGFALPLGAARFLVLVSAAVPPLRASDLSLFITDGRQGVNLRRGVWHHFRIALESTHDFIVIDRAGNGNSEQTEVADEVWIREV